MTSQDDMYLDNIPKCLWHLEETTHLITTSVGPYQLVQECRPRREYRCGVVLLQPIRAVAAVLHPGGSARSLSFVKSFGYAFRHCIVRNSAIASFAQHAYTGLIMRQSCGRSFAYFTLVTSCRREHGYRTTEWSTLEFWQQRSGVDPIKGVWLKLPSAD
ncbi:hypothetical protein L209DRAFT_752554 [Thermothelomyces heterothallicus CBS 203.75]